MTIELWMLMPFSTIFQWKPRGQFYCKCGMYIDRYIYKHKYTVSKDTLSRHYAFTKYNYIENAKVP